MSVNMADLYGLSSDSYQTMQPTSVSGPTQGSVAPATRSAGGASGSGGSAAVTFTWVGLILVLIAWRLLIVLAK